MTDLVRLVRWARRRRQRPELPPIRAMQVGDRVWCGGTLGVEGIIDSITPDRRLVTIVDDDGQAHWADGRRIHRLP